MYHWLNNVGKQIVRLYLLLYADKELTNTCVAKQMPFHTDKMRICLYYAYMIGIFQNSILDTTIMPPWI